MLYDDIGAFEGRNRETKNPNNEEKGALHQKYAPHHKSMASMAKLHKFHFDLLPHQLYFQDLTPQQLLPVHKHQDNAHQKERYDCNEALKLKRILKGGTNRSIRKV